MNLSHLCCLAACCLGLASCNDNPSNRYEGLSVAELHARAKRLPLKERYAMYLDVYDDRTPRNPILASDIVELGQQARDHAISRASSAGPAEYGAILSLLSSFGADCSPQEYALLTSAAQKLEPGKKAFAAREEWISVACSKYR